MPSEDELRFKISPYLTSDKSEGLRMGPERTEDFSQFGIRIEGHERWHGDNVDAPEAIYVVVFDEDRLVELQKVVHGLLKEHNEKFKGLIG